MCKTRTSIAHQSRPPRPGPENCRNTEVHEKGRIDPLEVVLGRVNTEALLKVITEALVKVITEALVKVTTEALVKVITGRATLITTARE